ncbi:MAG: hypothetical protein ABH874_01780 [Methanobacteriota archaeon]
MNKMGDVVTIPKREYEFLVKCKTILELERDEEFAPEFLEKLKRAEGSIKAGKGKTFKTSEEVEKYLRSL